MPQTLYCGNSVEQYHYHKESCCYCYGQGVVEATHMNIEAYLETKSFSREQRKALVQEWKQLGAVPCAKCDGAGTWEVKL